MVHGQRSGLLIKKGGQPWRGKPFEIVRLDDSRNESRRIQSRWKRSRWRGHEVRRHAAGVVAIRHARRIAVTASIDRLDFHYPVFIGNLLILKASMNLVGRTSNGSRGQSRSGESFDRRVRIRLSLSHLCRTGRKRSANLCASLICETDEEKLRNRQAQIRDNIVWRKESGKRAATCRSRSFPCDALA